MFSQPRRLDARRLTTQQQAQTPDKPGQPEQQMGEGSYEGTRDYQENIKTYLDQADVKSDAEAAKPHTPEEAEALKKAEEEGLSHTKSPGQ